MGPGKGLDNAVITLPGGKLVVVTADPVSFIPGLGARLSAWLSVHLVASDFTTSGVAPQFATFTFNFPQVMTQGDRVSYLKEVGRACAELGVAIVAGHTGAYPGASLSGIGGGTMCGLAKKGGYVVPSMARVGDVILMTKGAAIEATASLSNAFPRYTADRVGGPLTRKARDLVTSSSTVKYSLSESTLLLCRY